MVLTKLLEETLGKTCDCGRPRRPVHCPSCGWHSLTVKDTNNAIVDVSGVSVNAQGFRCRICGVNFSEATPCTATPTPERTAGQIAEEREAKRLELMSKMENPADRGELVKLIMGEAFPKAEQKT